MHDLQKECRLSCAVDIFREETYSMDSLKHISTGLLHDAVTVANLQRREEPAAVPPEPEDSVGISRNRARKAPSDNKTPAETSQSDKTGSILPGKSTVKDAATGAQGTLEDGAPAKAQVIPSSDIQEAPDNSATDAMRNNARNATCTFLGDLGARFKAGELKEDSFQKASNALYDLLHNPQGDPLVRKMARELMYDYVAGATPADDWQLKRGSITGPSEYISNLWHSLDNCGDKTYFGPENDIRDFLDALQTESYGISVPEDALKAVAHFSQTMQRRGDADFKPEIRGKEPRDSDYALARDSASLVEYWWHHEQISVTKDGREVLPGSLNLQEIVRGERVEIHGSEIRLSSPAPRPPAAVRAQVKEIFDAIDPYEPKENHGNNERDKGFAILCQRAEKNSDEAGTILGIFISGIGGGIKRGDYDLRKLGRILKEGQNNPALKGLLTEQLPTLSTLISRYHGREMLVANNLEEESKVDFARNLTGTFPELLKDERFFREEMGTLLTSRDINTRNSMCTFMKELFEKDAALVKPTIDIILSDWGQPYLDQQQCWLIRDACMKYGWLPDRPQAESLLPKLYQPVGKDGRSLLSNNYSDSEEFPMALNLFNRIRKEKPELIDGFELPDRNLRMVPLAEALKDRMYVDPSDDNNLMYILCKEKNGSFSSCHWVKDYYDLIFSDEKAVTSLLDSFEREYRKAGALIKLTRKGKMDFAFLSSLEMEPENEKRFRTLIKSERYDKQGLYAFSDYVDLIRIEEIGRDMEAMRRGALTPSKQITTTFDALKMAHRMGGSFDIGQKSDEILNAMENGINATSMNLDKEAEELLSTLESDLAAGGTFSKSPESTLMVFQVLEHLSRRSPALFDSIYALLKPGLDLNHSNGKRIVNKLLDPFREKAVMEMMSGLWEQTVTPMERVRSYAGEVPALMKKSDVLPNKWRYGGMETAFREGMKEHARSPEIRDIPLNLHDPAHAFDAYSHLAEKEKDEDGMGKAWLRFREVLEHVGGESQYDVAKSFYDFIEEEVGKGREREKCLKHCMRAYALEQNPRMTPWSDDSIPSGTEGTIEVCGNNINIGGIKLDIRQDDSL